MEAVGAAEAADLERCRARLRQLVEAGPAPKDGALAWNRPRLDRILVDHMLRYGYHASAAQLTSERGIQARPHPWLCPWPSTLLRFTFLPRF